jgi:phosphatidylinositol alpha-1,6-mannosyltransferase
VKLLALVTDAFGARGGIAKFNRDLLEALCHDPTVERVVALPRNIVDPISSLPPKLAFERTSARGKGAYVGAALGALTRGMDGVICGHLNLLPLAAVVATGAGVRLLLVVHGVEAWNRPANPMIRASVRRVDALVAVSDFSRRRFLEWAKVGRASTAVVPNCVDLDAFVPGERRSDLARRYNLENRTVMLTVARLSACERYKGVDELLELMPTLSADIPNLSYLIVGDGDDRQRLEKKAESLGIGDRVCFAGYVAESEKADHYRLADVFVMPGRGEGFGIVYLEALACGVPVVASSADASSEVVLGGELGAVVDPSDSSAIRRAITEALQRPAPARDRLAYFSRERFEDRWQRVVADVFADRHPARRFSLSLGRSS